MKLFSSNGYRTSLLFAALSAVYIGLTSANAMAENTIDFSKSTNLRAIYDAGLRPWRTRPDEKRILKITNQEVRLVAPGATPFTLDVEIGSLQVRAENELGEAEFVSQPMSLPQAAAKAREICGALGIPINGLGEKASQLATLGNQTPAPQYWNGRGEKAGIRFSVTLDGLFGWDETRGKLIVVFQFSKPGKSLAPLTEPIRPPPGYEHLSMERPETHPDTPFPDPAYSRENMIRKFEEANTAGNQTPRATTTLKPSSPSSTAAEAPNLEVERRALVWPWVIGILALIVIVAFALKWRA